jgi:hypothetical protein
MASGTRGSSVPRFSTTGRVTSLQHVLKNVLKCDLTSPLYLSVLQHFGGRTNSTLSITSYAIRRILRTLATLRQLLRTPRRRILPR